METTEKDKIEFDFKPWWDAYSFAFTTPKHFAKIEDPACPPYDASTAQPWSPAEAEGITAHWDGKATQQQPDDLVVEFSEDDYKDLIRLRAVKEMFGEKAEFWRKVAESREDCFAKLVRAEAARDQFADDYEQTYEQLEETQKRLAKAEEQRDEWMGLTKVGMDTHKDMENLLRLNVDEKIKALRDRNAAVFVAAIVLGGNAVNLILALWGSM